jgi:hypothetical protein
MVHLKKFIAGADYSLLYCNPEEKGSMRGKKYSRFQKPAEMLNTKVGSRGGG